MSFVYHGSPNQSLKIIEPRVGTHHKAYVYATEELAKALIFARRSGFGDETYNIEFDKPEPIILCERVPDAFKKIFDIPGSVYKLNDKNFSSFSEGCDFEVVSTREEDVVEEVQYANVLDELEERSKKGEVKLYYYPDRPSYIPGDDSDLISKYVQWALEDMNEGIDLEEIFQEVEENHPHLLSEIKLYLGFEN